MKASLTVLFCSAVPPNLWLNPTRRRRRCALSRSPPVSLVRWAPYMGWRSV